MSGQPDGRDGAAPLRVVREPATAGGAGAVLRLVGELDIATAAQLDQALATLTREGATVVVLDVAELAFMDSSGLGVLLRAARSGTRIRLRRASGAVRELIGATGLSDVLQVEP